MRLSKPQMLIYTMEKYTGGAVGVLCGSYLLGKKVEEEKLVNALNEIVKRNSALRTVIKEKEEVEQYCISYYPYQYDTKHFSSIEEMDRFADEYAKTPVDIHDRLFEFIVLSLPDNSGILIKMHHIIGDAWTLSLLCKQLNMILDGQEPSCGDYAHYIESENVYIQSKRYKRDRDYFIEGFKEVEVEGIVYLSDSSSKSKTARRKEVIIGVDEAKAIQQYCKEHSVSVFILFTEALSIVYSRLCNNEENFYLGIAILNRGTEEELNTVGMFVNTVPMLVDLDYTVNFDTNLKKTKDNMLLTIRHQKYNYRDLLKEIREETDFKGQLYDVIISYQNAKIADLDGRVRSKWYPSGIQNESLQIHIDDRDSEGIFRVNYDYQTEKFSEKQIERLHGYMMNILHEGMKNGDTNIAQIRMLPEEELHTLMHDFKGKAVYYPKDKCIHELFEEKVRQHPNKAAVIACDQTLSYDSLNRLANRVAYSLRRRGIKTGDLIGVKLPRRSYFFAAVLGVLKSGAAYIPMDPDYPQERIDYMIRDSSASLLIDENNVETFLTGGCEDNPGFNISSEEKCYCRYTSGSTGNPKGVMICHRNVVNLAFEMDRLEKVDVVLGVTNVGFDMCVAENLYSIMTGKTLVFVEDESIVDGRKLAELIIKYKVDMMTTTPAKMKLYLRDSEMERIFGSLRVLSFGGEKISKEFMEWLRGFSDAVLSNEYGPTETTCYSTTCIIRGSVGEVTIGKPIANTQVYIVDKYMNITPIGVKGELCIAGDGVGLGYLNRPELTAEKFIKNPFGEGRLYKTGDIAYWNEDGDIVFIGRNDSQVKVRGLRIELGEIEAAITAIDGIEQAMVVVREDRSKNQLIYAFYAGKEFDDHYIKEKLRISLPKYMIPSIFKHLDAIPMNRNGKINRNAFPELNLNVILKGTEYVAPRNDMEIKLCALLSQVMDVDKIGVTTDFFDLGLDSLRAIEFTLKARMENIDIPLQKVYEHPTVEELVKYLMGADSVRVKYSEEEFKKYRNILSKNVFSDSDEIVWGIRNLGIVALTGATGFLGSQILDQLIKSGVEKIFCVVRSEERLTNALSYYFDEKYGRDVGTKIIPVVSDIEMDDLHTCIHEHVDTVIHAAACVKHYGRYEFFERINVGGTKRVLELARKNHARFIHISTLSISGDTFVDAELKGRDRQTDFDERCLYVGQSLENVYIRSKFKAERIVLDAVADGMDAKIIRVGNLTNRYSDLRFQPNYHENAFVKRFRALIGLGMIPDYLMKHSIDFSPVDLTASGIVKLAEYASGDQTVFHLNNDKVLPFDRAIGYFRQTGIMVDVVDSSEFTKALANVLHIPGKAWIYETFQTDLDGDGVLRFENKIHVKNDSTVNFLKRIGFEWPEIGSEYISGYIHYFRKLGYFL